MTKQKVLKNRRALFRDWNVTRLKSGFGVVQIGSIMMVLVIVDAGSNKVYKFVKPSVIQINDFNSPVT